MAGKLDIMLELEKRGQLPEDKKAILVELRRRGEISSPIEKSESLNASMQSASRASGPKDINPLASGIMSASNVASLGLMPYLVAGADSLGQINAAALRGQSYLPGGMKKEFSNNLAAARNVQHESETQNPLSSLAGSVAGFVMPGSLSNKLYQGVSNLALRGAPELVQGAGALKNSGAALSLLLRNILGGGAASVLTGQATSNLPLSDVEDRKQQAVGQFLLGGGLQGAGSALSSGVKGAKLALQTPYGQELMKLPGELPFVGRLLAGLGRTFNAKQVAEQEASKIAQEGSILAGKQNALADVQALNPAEAKETGGLFSKWFAKKAGTFRNQFQELKGGVLSKFGNAKANVSGLAANVDEVLSKDFGFKINEVSESVPSKVLDSSGKPIEKTVSNLVSNEADVVTKIADPEKKRAFQTLLKIRDSLKSQKFSLRELDDLRQDFQALAKYSSKNQSQYDVLYSQMSQAVDDAFMSNLERVGGQKALGDYQKANQIYSKNISLFNKLKSISSESPENVVKYARTNFRGSFLDEVSQSEPDLVQPIKQIILNDIAINARKPDQLTKIIDTYGRDSLSKFLGKTDYQKLLTIEAKMTDAFARKVVLPETKLPAYLENAIDKADKTGKFMGSGTLQIIFNQLLK